MIVFLVLSALVSSVFSAPNSNSTQVAQPLVEKSVQGVQTTSVPTIVVTETPTSTYTITPTQAPTSTPTLTPKPTVKKILYTPAPTKKVQTITEPQVQIVQNNEAYSCNCSKTCPQINSCAEAQYLLNSCGCSARNGDDDGIACDAMCQ